MNKRVFWTGFLFYFWLTGIFIVSSIPDIGSNEEKVLGFDKLAHFSEYFGLAVFFILMKRERRQPVLPGHYLFLAIPLPFIEELHQLLIPGRQFSLMDIAADWAGVSVVFAGYYLLNKLTVLKP